MRAFRLTLVCSGITWPMRKGTFPRDELLEKQSIDRAKALASRLAKADRALTAPSLRAKQTAELLGLGASVVNDLRDQDYGLWSGRSPEEIEEGQPGALARWRADPDYAPGDGESLAALSERVAGFLNELSGDHRHVIAVTHASVIRTAIVQVLSAPLSATWNVDVAPLSVTDLRSDGTRWVLRAHGSLSSSQDGG